MPHGFACAAFLTEMLVRVREYDPAYSDAFNEEIGVDDETYVRLIEGCLPDFGIRMTEEEIVAALPRWENNGSVRNTRADVTVDDIHVILGSLFS